MKLMISYSHCIREDVLQFREAILKNVSLYKRFPNFSDKDCWIDDFMTNDILKDMLMAISEADIIIMCLSPEYAKSDNCMFEAQLSKAHEKFIIPVIFTGEFPFDNEYLEDLIDPNTLRITLDRASFEDTASRVVDIILTEMKDSELVRKFTQNIPRQIRSMSMTSTLSGSSSMLTTPRSPDGMVEANNFINTEGLGEVELNAIRGVLNKNPRALHSITDKTVGAKGRIALLQIIYTDRIV